MTEADLTRINWLCSRVDKLNTDNRGLTDEIKLLKMQLISVEQQRHMRELELAVLKAKGTHIESCRTPRTSFRRIGSVWQCECGQTWRLGYLYDLHKRWQKAA